MKKIDTSIEIVGLHLDSSPREEVLKSLEGWIDNSSKVAYIFTPNPEQVILAWRKPSFQATLQQARWLLPDGVGLVWASQFKSLFSGKPHLEKTIPGRVIAEDLLTLAQSKKEKVLLIGGRGYSGQFPASWPITWIEGYADVTTPTREEEQLITKTIASLRPAIVMVALGAPHQEEWLVEHHDLLNKAHVKLGMSVGGTFDILTGKISRAPGVVSRLGLEWLYRLIQEPWRWRRQSQLPLFIWIAFKDLFTRSKE